MVLLLELLLPRMRKSTEKLRVSEVKLEAMLLMCGVLVLLVLLLASKSLQSTRNKTISILKRYMSRLESHS